MFKYCRQSSLVINRSWSELPQSHIFKFISFHADPNCHYNFSTLSFPGLIPLHMLYWWLFFACYTGRANITEGSSFWAGAGWAHRWEHLQINDIYFKNCEKISCEAACTNSLGTSITTSYWSNSKVEILQQVQKCHWEKICHGVYKKAAFTLLVLTTEHFSPGHEAS